MAFDSYATFALFRVAIAPYLCAMPERDAETDRVRLIYDRRSLGGRAQTSGAADLRWLCSRAEGETLEIGIGRGRTLPYYPEDIHLSGIELSPVALGIARQRVRDLGLNVALQEGDAAALPFGDDHFDTVVFSFALCTIPDDRAAIGEAVRVLRPGGRLLLVEHVRSPHLLIRALERLFDPITVRRDGDHLMREPLDHVLAEDLTVECLERRLLGIVERLSACKPEADDLAEAV
jgi:SAM-dependent methyltransferase